ncbi:hypothetical protein DEO72_LG7g2027 [Vigna unguiculata]|uniref:Uncharacterized protein n=1 Tax=Vigna unguiculata TaxID=3917 RepID=A0A4D6ML55_VIGUN|nr:hypothetical protein DEO72_LG7g2027 [Vigna unguiculata]
MSNNGGFYQKRLSNITVRIMSEVSEGSDFSVDRKVISDVVSSADELNNTFVKEGFEEFGRGSKGGRKDELMEVI